MESFEVDIHHGGTFIQTHVLHYLGGKVSKIKDQDPDKMSYFEVKGLVGDLGYSTSIKLYYRDPSVSFASGLKLMYDDSCIPDLLMCANKTGVLDVYVDHCAQVEVTETLNLDLSTQGWLDNAQDTEDIVHNQTDLGDDVVTQPDLGEGAVTQENTNDITDMWAHAQMAVDIHGEFTSLLCSFVNNYNKTSSESDNDPESNKGTESNNVDVSDDKSGPEENNEDGYESDESDAASLDHMSDDEELADVRKKKLEMKGKGKKDDNMDGDGVAGDGVAGGNVLGSDGLGFNFPPTNTDGDDSDSVFLDVSDCDSPFYSSDEDGQSNHNPRPIFPVWNPKTEMSKSVPELGMKFGSPKDLKLCITNFSITNGYPIKFDRNDHKRLLAHCVEGCKWRLYATWMQEERSFQIKSLKPIHTCVRAFNLPLVNATWLAGKFANKIQMNPKWKLRDMVQEVKEKFNIDVSISQCFRAKQKALGDVEKSLVEHYSRVWDYGAHILKTNVGSTVKIMVNRPDPNGPTYFHRMYVCLDAIKRGWLEGCRPVIGLDGCFLKGYVKGELLTAVGRDGNNQMFPIAWAVVEVENRESWSWFLELLMDDLGARSNRGNGWTVITDQQKGLMPAITDLIPNAEHRCCARHIYANMRKKYTTTSLKSLFWEAAKSGTAEEFQAVMGNLCKENQGAYEYLINQNPTTWSRAYFQFHSKCDAVENNMCETLNGSIIEARYKPLIYMLEALREAAMSRMAKKKVQIAKWDQIFTPKAVEKVEQVKADHRFWRTTYNGDKEFEVKNEDVGYVVNIEKCYCSCRMWSLSGIPCAHAISAIYYIKDDPYKYVSDCYKVEVIKAAYSNCIKGVDGQNLWPKTGYPPMLPPPARRMPGRPKKARRKGEQEKLDPKKTKVTKRGTKIQCQNCKQYGHNRKTCKANSVTTENPTRKQKKRTKEGEGTSSGTNKRSKVKDKVPAGFGLYIAPETGNTYFRGSCNVVNIGGPIPQISQVQNATQAKKRNNKKKALANASPTVVTRNSAQNERVNTRATAAKRSLMKSGIFPI